MVANVNTRTRIDLGRSNRRAVLGEIVFQGGLSRTAIAARTGLTSASVSRITKDLLNAGLIVESPREGEATGPGRRFVDLDLNPSGGYVLGIGFNLFHQSVSLADLENRLIDRIDLGLPSVHDPEVVIGRIVEVAQGMLRRLGGDRARLLGGSIAVTGAIDPILGVVRESPILRWRDVDIGGRLSAALGVPMIVESLPNAIALAEARFGIARNCRHILLVNCSLGLGASCYTDGALLRGRNFSAGLIAKVPVAGAGGSVGRLDDMASGLGVLRRLGISPGADGQRLAGNVEAVKLMEVLRTAADGDAVSADAISAAGRMLGAALAQFAGLVSPELIILSGPMAQSTVYVAAVVDAVKSLFANGVAEIPFKISNTSPQAAARWLAIGEFLVNRDLDIEALRLEEAS